MKNTIFAVSALLSMHTALGISITKHNVSINYKKCWFFQVKADFHSHTHSLPYRISITNNSNYPIIVDRNLITTSLYSANQLAQDIRSEYKFSALLALTIPFILFPAGKCFIPREKQKNFFKVCVLGTILSIPIVYFLFSRTTREKLEMELQQAILDDPFTIQPGESVEKLFWPKCYSIKKEDINFDAIKILK